MSRSEQELLREAVVHLELMLEHARGDMTDQMVIDAVCLRLSAGIEVLSRLAPSVREGMFGDTWPLMWGMRNRIAHGYVLVEPTIIRQTLTADVPDIVAKIRNALRGEPI